MIYITAVFLFLFLFLFWKVAHGIRKLRISVEREFALLEKKLVDVPVLEEAVGGNVEH